MKRFVHIFLICYVVTSVFFIYFFGNMNFFGEQGFHMDIVDLITILTTWALASALILAGILAGIIYIITKLGKKSK